MTDDGEPAAGLNPAVAGMARSGIRDIMDAAWGRPGVIRLEVGEPDFPTPPHIIEAAHVAMLEGHTGYQPSAGIGPLREAIAAKVRERNGYTVTPQQVIVTQGGVEALFASLLTLARPGDEVLMPDPAWPNFLLMAQMQNLTAVTYPADGGAWFPAHAGIARGAGHRPHRGDRRQLPVQPSRGGHRHASA